MLMVWLGPTCVQVDPLGEIYALKVLPLRTILTQYGAEIAPEFVNVVLPPVVVRRRNSAMGAPVIVSQVRYAE